AASAACQLQRQFGLVVDEQIVDVGGAVRSAHIARHQLLDILLHDPQRTIDAAHLHGAHGETFVALHDTAQHAITGNADQRENTDRHQHLEQRETARAHQYWPRYATSESSGAAPSARSGRATSTWILRNIGSGVACTSATITQSCP